MAKCPKCSNEITKSEKKWNYGQFKVRAYLCDKGTTAFREYYTKDGKLSFILVKEERGNYVKA
jgi:hypothetical protein